MGASARLLGAPGAVPIVSVVIPAYNRGHCIGRCIRSVLAQTLLPLEVIVVDDASSDDTAKQVAQFDDARLQYVRHESNRGAAAARNTAARIARGEYLAFLDSDDVWHERTLEAQVTALEAAGEGCGMSYSWISCVDESGREVARYESLIEGDCLHDMLATNFVGSFSNVVMRRKLLVDIGMLDESLPSCQDWDLFVRIAARSRLICLRKAGVACTRGVSDPYRISNNRRAVVSGHRLMLAKHGSAYKELPERRRAHAYLRFMQVFAEAGSLADTVRLLPQVVLNAGFGQKMKALRYLVRACRKSALAALRRQQYRTTW